ncbi:hypothetical protein CYMTET_15947 [Cymbomonas tetramitiformis]|uniref:Uncharacterized protein n=1 Tax=Cymbomonas tetramitiformis TaxID=36881 RepID=A0AAE0L8E9_9CHLO|nr:hypothetical protein CYMTET_15947 [Cymbomonas tetramitiformis]
MGMPTNRGFLSVVREASRLAACGIDVFITKAGTPAAAKACGQEHPVVNGVEQPHGSGQSDSWAGTWLRHCEAI